MLVNDPLYENIANKISRRRNKYFIILETISTLLFCFFVAACFSMTFATWLNTNPKIMYAIIMISKDLAKGIPDFSSSIKSKSAIWISNDTRFVYIAFG